MTSIEDKAMRRTTANSAKRALRRNMRRLTRQAVDRTIATGEPEGKTLKRLMEKEAASGKALPGVEPLPASDTSISKKDRERQRVIARLRQEAEAKAHQEGRPFEEVFERLKTEYRRHRVL